MEIGWSESNSFLDGLQLRALAVTRHFHQAEKLATMRRRDGAEMLTGQYEVNGSPSGLLHMLTAVLTFAPGEPYDRAGFPTPTVEIREHVGRRTQG